MTEKTPGDRKPKAEAGHRFTVKGKTYTLPPISENAAESLPGEITYAVIMEPDNEMAQLRLAFASLEAAKPSEAALKALKSLPTSEMIEVVGEWMGGSSASSD